MNSAKRILAMLLLLCLMVCCTVPAAQAAELTGSERLSAQRDYSRLELQIAAANGLNSFDYTKETWNPLEKAVEKGNQVLKGVHGQYTINETAKAIESAIAGLVRMDYSALDMALGLVYSRIDENPELHNVWSRLDKTVENARPLLVSGDQAAVDAAVEEINALMEELDQTDTKTAAEPEIIIQEVEVEVLPSDEYCNIPMHRTWPILFVISAVLNVAFIIILTYVIMKKRNAMDTTPLVSYDIDDDIDF